MYRLFTLIFLLNCSSHYIYSDTKLDRFLEETPLFQSGFTGFSVYDLTKNELIYACNETKYFTPASTAKFFTFYTALKYLPDSLIGLRYNITDSTIYFQGTGEPSLFVDSIYTSQVLNMLKDSTKAITYTPIKWNEPKYGSGWAWDDYKFSYQAEKFHLPMYKNVLTIQSDSLLNVSIRPSYFKTAIHRDTNNIVNGIKINRYEKTNMFQYAIGQIDSITERSIPFITSDSLMLNLLEDTLHKKINIIQIDSLLPMEIQTTHKDSLLKDMMTESDNFLAEQFILMTSINKNKEFNSKKIFKFISDSIMSDMPQKPRISDGSGLSRYNLATPSNFIYLLKDLYQFIPEKRLFSLLTQNGKKGTLENRLEEYPQFLFAKTGTLSNNHSIVGYIRTRSGNTLAFAFIINHFRTPLSLVKKQIDRLLADYYLYYE